MKLRIAKKIQSRLRDQLADFIRAEDWHSPIRYRHHQIRKAMARVRKWRLREQPRDTDWQVGEFEIREVSIVSVPCNPNAVVIDHASGSAPADVQTTPCDG